MLKNVLQSFSKLSLCQPVAREYSVAKRKLIRKEYFVYRPTMKSRYKGNPFPRLKMLLTEDVEDVGLKGEVVEVTRKVGRNQLVPRKQAIYATPENLIARGIDPKIALANIGPKVPTKVLDYLDKQSIQLSIDPQDPVYITRHDIAEYFFRDAHLVVPAHCMRVTRNVSSEDVSSDDVISDDVTDDVITDVGDYLLHVTLNNVKTVSIPLQVSMRIVPE